MIDSGKVAGTTPTQTLFHLSPYFADFECPDILLGRGAHKPSLVESLAPFHSDPSQRIVVLHTTNPRFYLVLRVGPLLELLESHEGSEIAWDEWKSHTFIPSIDLDPRNHVEIWVSGCRMFSLIPADSGSGAHAEVYDFSVLGRAKYLSEPVHEGLAGVRCLSSTGERAHFQVGSIIYACSGHDTFTFLEVSLICHSPCK